MINVWGDRVRETQRLSSDRALKAAYSSVSEGGGDDGGEENGLVRAASSGEVNGDEEEEPSELVKLRDLLMDKWINLMIVFVPAGIVVTYAGCSETTIFVVNFLAMVVSSRSIVSFG